MSSYAKIQNTKYTTETQKKVPYVERIQGRGARARPARLEGTHNRKEGCGIRIGATWLGFWNPKMRCWVSVVGREHVGSGCSGVDVMCGSGFVGLGGIGVL